MGSTSSSCSGNFIQNDQELILSQRGVLDQRIGQLQRKIDNLPSTINTTQNQTTILSTQENSSFLVPQSFKKKQSSFNTKVKSDKQNQQANSQSYKYDVDLMESQQINKDAQNSVKNSNKNAERAVLSVKSNQKINQKKIVSQDNKVLQNSIFIEEIYEDGSIYKGEISFGDRDGQGTLFYSKGGRYEGNWKKGKMNGFGKLYYPNGDLAYQGNFSNNKFNGIGQMFNERVTFETQQITYQNFNLLDDNWVSYQGEFSNDLKNGKGKLILSNGDVFEGQFKLDFVHGKGIFSSSKGEVIIGEWSVNRLIETISKQNFNLQQFNQL